MDEKDRLSELLKEWRQPEPSPELDDRVVEAYRAATWGRGPRGWKRVLGARVSIPVPVLALAALLVIALLLWMRPAAAPAATAPAPPSHPGVEQNVVTSLSATGFQPLPNGAAQVVSGKEVH